MYAVPRHLDYYGTMDGMDKSYIQRIGRMLYQALVNLSQ